MKLKRFLLRYYPPGIILEYEQSKTLKTKSIDLLDLRPESDVDAVLDDIVAKEPLVTPAKMEQVRKLLLRLQEKIGETSNHKFYLFKVLRAHILPLTNVAFNKSGSSFITGSYDRTCKVWDTVSGEELHTLEGHKNVVYAVAFNNPYGDKIATGSFDKTCKLWNAETGKCYHTFRGHSAEIVCLAFNVQSTVIATGSMDNTAKLWDIQKGTELATLMGHSAEIICLAFNTTGDQILTGSFDHTVSVWDVLTGRRIHTLIGHRGEIANAQFNFDSSLIISGSMDKTCKLWDVESGKCVGTLRGHDDEVLDVTFDLTGQYIVTGSADGTGRVYNTTSHQCICKLEGHEGEISKVVFNPQGTKILTASSDKTARLWDTFTGQCLQIWISRIKRDPRKDFTVTKHTKVCSEHFVPSDFIFIESKVRRLKKDACPSVFRWTKSAQQRTFPAKRQRLEEKIAVLAEEETDTASEGEGKYYESDKKGFYSRYVQVAFDTPCSHRFSLQALLALSDTKEKEKKLFKHMTGFDSHSNVIRVLKFVLPDMDRANIIYWACKSGKGQKINTSLLFEGHCTAEEPNEQSQYEDYSSYSREHLLPVEDEFLLVLMKLRLGLTNLDLAVRFRRSEGTVSNIIITWLNFLYIQLGKLNIWPHRNVLIENMPKKFKEDYPNNITIIDCTELRIQCPSALVLQSQSYSNYKSTNTLKSLVGVDSKGGFMFVSHLYTGNISDKEIVLRSGFLDILAKKKEMKEIIKGDSIMADKGFDIHKDLDKIGMTLNIPQFLKDKSHFQENEVIATQTIARHRIHVERAIGKVRNFLIFNSKLPVSLLGTVNQLWTVCCLLSNFMEPIVHEKDDI